MTYEETVEWVCGLGLPDFEIRVDQIIHLNKMLQPGIVNVNITNYDNGWGASTLTALAAIRQLHLLVKNWDRIHKDLHPKTTLGFCFAGKYDESEVFVNMIRRSPKLSNSIGIEGPRIKTPFGYIPIYRGDESRRFRGLTAGFVSATNVDASTKETLDKCLTTVRSHAAPEIFQGLLINVATPDPNKEYNFTIGG